MRLATNTTGKRVPTMSHPFTGVGRKRRWLVAKWSESLPSIGYGAFSFFGEPRGARNIVESHGRWRPLGTAAEEPLKLLPEDHRTLNGGSTLSPAPTRMFVQGLL